LANTAYGWYAAVGTQVLLLVVVLVQHDGRPLVTEATVDEDLDEERGARVVDWHEVDLSIGTRLDDGTPARGDRWWLVVLAGRGARRRSRRCVLEQWQEAELRWLLAARALLLHVSGLALEQRHDAQLDAHGGTRGVRDRDANALSDAALREVAHPARAVVVRRATEHEVDER